MREIRRSTAFKRDYKREKRGPHGKELEGRLRGVVTSLAEDRPLQPSFSDHPLSGAWSGYRDCHVWPDLVLIYAKPDKKSLDLVRLGSHSELFG